MSIVDIIIQISILHYFIEIESLQSSILEFIRISSNDSFITTGFKWEEYRQIKIYVYLLFFSGIVLGEDINLAWDITRLIIPIHIIFSDLVLFWQCPFLYNYIRKIFHSRGKIVSLPGSISNPQKYLFFHLLQRWCYIVNEKFWFFTYLGVSFLSIP